MDQQSPKQQMKIVDLLARMVAHCAGIFLPEAFYSIDLSLLQLINHLFK
ncbi:hypothetical protein VISI1226_10602 [Vibrio sinaloensis DSM 21326]|uniref:Uncharacterized protein n=1 Tax=Vibrio sinaloensis DSM 21326 TaxID=945550 RepID=E8MAU2_PHOS4|nr:hypothetical protein VISI1226_10602 [Vibrio sinaloensis DSM 21326]